MAVLDKIRGTGTFGNHFFGFVFYFLIQEDKAKLLKRKIGF